MKNRIYLEKRNCILVPTSKVKKNASLGMVAAAVRNIECLGYALDTEVVFAMKTLSETELDTFYNSLVADLKRLRGSHARFNPMYPNFPKQVMDASDAELFCNAVIHYIGDVAGYRWLPEYEEQNRGELPLFEEKELEVVKLGTEADFIGIFTNMLASKSSLSAQDKDYVKFFVTNLTNEMKEYVPASIPHKETLTYFTGLILSNNINPGSLCNLIKTATDVLRLATALSDGDVSLAANTKYKNFSRPHRRFFLSLLDNAGKPKHLAEDMMRHKSKWLRLGEKLHPGQYKDRYVNAAQAFDLIRNDQVVTFNSNVEAALEDKKHSELLALLQNRPGEFARRLDHVLRTFRAEKKTLKSFESVADKVSVPVLLSLASHFKNRKSGPETRIFFPKGNAAKAKTIANTLKPVSETLATQISAICDKSIMSSLENKESLGKVFIDPDMANYAVPLKERSANAASKAIARGSKIDLGTDKNVIRFFLWWKNIDPGRSRVDVDLSAAILDENWNFVEHISYTNLRSDKYQAAHSGDITSAPNGACEFIDINLSQVAAMGGKYIVPSVYSFTGQMFSDMPECFSGWMMRSEVAKQRGQIFDARTVEHKFDIVSQARNCIPMVIDTVNKKAIWMDLALTNRVLYNNIESNKAGTIALAKAMVERNLPNLYDLCMLNALARGELVENRDEADTVFAVDGDITPFDTSRITSELM